MFCFLGICGFLTTPLTVGPFLWLSLASGWGHFCEGHAMLPPIISPTHLVFSPILYSMVGTLVNGYILCHASQKTDPHCQIIPKPCPHSSSGLSLPHFGAVYMQSSVVTCRPGFAGVCRPSISLVLGREKPNHHGEVLLL